MTSTPSLKCSFHEIQNFSVTQHTKVYMMEGSIIGICCWWVFEYCSWYKYFSQLQKPHYSFSKILLVRDEDVICPFYSRSKISTISFRNLQNILKRNIILSFFSKSLSLFQLKSAPDPNISQNFLISFQLWDEEIRTESLQENFYLSPCLRVSSKQTKCTACSWWNIGTDDGSSVCNSRSVASRWESTKRWDHDICEHRIWR